MCLGFRLFPHRPSVMLLLMLYVLCPLCKATWEALTRSDDETGVVGSLADGGDSIAAVVVLVHPDDVRLLVKDHCHQKSALPLPQPESADTYDMLP